MVQLQSRFIQCEPDYCIKPLLQNYSTVVTYYNISLLSIITTMCRIMYDQQAYRELVQVAVEHALLDMGPPELARVKTKLKENFGITTEDVFDHPEYLKTVLYELFGNASSDIIYTMRRVFDKSINEEPIQKFIQIIEN